MEKCDAETGNIIPMTGTGFQIKDLSTGEFVTQDIYYPNPETLDTFYVSDEGWLMLPEPLRTGDYELYEVAAPYGYVLSSEPVPFTIDGSEAVVTVTQYNMPQKGQLTITKTGEVFASVQENDGLYQPVYEVMGLPGAVYDVIADEDIYTGDGTLRAAKDTVAETLTTGEDGTAQSGLLYLGRYRLEERQAPEGMVLNTQPEYAELTYAGETVEVTYERDGKRYTAELTPLYDEELGRYRYGFVGGEVEKGNVFKNLLYSGYEVKYWIDTTFGSLKMLATGGVTLNDMSGPVGLVDAIGDSYEESVSYGYYAAFLQMLYICILISANLGVMNLLPLPALDGGRLLFLIVEVIRGKRVDPDKEGMVHFIGMMLLFALMFFTFFNDIRKLFG